MAMKMPYVRWHRQTEKPCREQEENSCKKKEKIMYSRSEIENLIDTYIVGRNAIRNRQILKDKLIDGLTYEQIAEKVDLTDRQVKNIVKKAKNQLFTKLK